MNSLDMDVEYDHNDEVYIVDAPWLDELVSAKTFEQAYELALEAKRAR